MPLRRSALVLPLLLAACAAGADDGLAPPGPSSPAAPFAERVEAEDADPIDVRASIDQGPARENFRAVAAWDFEPASADCNGWSASGARAIRAVPSHSGAYACKLCADGTSPEMRLTRRVAGLPRGRWVVSAWLRRLGAPHREIAARVALDEATESAGIPSSILLIDEWRLLGDPLEVPEDVASVTLSIVATAGPGECILVDDVVVESATASLARSPRPSSPYDLER